MIVGLLVVAPILLFKKGVNNNNPFAVLSSKTIHPLSNFALQIKKGIFSVWSDYIYLVDLKKANKLLEDKNGLLSEKLKSKQFLIDELRVQRHIFNGEASYVEYRSVTAEITLKGVENEALSFIINAGSQQGVKVNSTVVSHRGLVGRVEEVYSKSAKVVSIYDASHKISGYIPSKGTQFIVEGRGNVLKARLSLVDRSEDLGAGDQVFTSGLDGVYPKGIFVGNIVGIDKPLVGVLQNVWMKPAVDFNTSKYLRVLIGKKGL